MVARGTRCGPSGAASRCRIPARRGSSARRPWGRGSRIRAGWSFLLLRCVGGLGLRNSLWALLGDIGALHEDVERLRTDDIPGQRYDLSGTVQLFGKFLRIAVVGPRHLADLGAELLGRDVQGLRPRNGFQHQVGPDRPQRMLPAVLVEPVAIPALDL